MEKKQTYILLTVAVVMAIVVSVMIVVSSKSTTTSSGQLPGLQETQAPWQPETSKLAERIATLKMPAPGKETYHMHARLAVYVEGKQVPIPTDIGLKKTPAIMSALHTHGTDGVIHMEADRPFEAKISDFFHIWGVKFEASQIGAYKADGDKTVQIYVNGNKVDNGVSYVIKPKDSIVVGYGAPGSFPSAFPDEFPKEL